MSDEEFYEEEEAAPARKSFKQAVAAGEITPLSDEDVARNKEQRSAVTGSSRLSVVKAGWGAMDRTVNANSGFASSLKITTDIQIVKFLEDQPYASYSRHWAERMVGGVRKTRTYQCRSSVGECPICDIGNRAQTVIAFNVALIDADGYPTVKTWDAGAKPAALLKQYNSDPKIGPLSKGYFAVNKVGSKMNTQTNILPVRSSLLMESYDVSPADQDSLDALVLYTAADIEKQAVSLKDLKELALELADTGEYA